jgi:exonuclease SbcD
MIGQQTVRRLVKMDLGADKWINGTFAKPPWNASPPPAYFHLSQIQEQVMEFRLIHTSDWHLGHSLSQWPRNEEHQAFLTWLIDTLEEKQADALVVAGDIFDVSNPPASAVHQFYSFLAQARARMPQLEMVFIGGNHDSAARLNATNPILAGLNIHMIGGLPRTAQGIDCHPIVLRLANREGRPAAICGAMPHIRLSDLPPSLDPGEDPVLAGNERLHRQLGEAMSQAIEQGQAHDLPRILTGHAYLTGGSSSESERALVSGHLGGLPSSIYPPNIDYLALGHLHRTQMVGKNEHMRYSGAPIPLSLQEGAFRQVCLFVHFRGRHPSIEEIPVPRHTAVLRLPEKGFLALQPLKERLQQLPEADDYSGPLPFLELAVDLPSAQRGLQRELESLLQGKAARLVRIAKAAQAEVSLSGTAPRTPLKERDPLQVLDLCCQKLRGAPPSPPLRELFQTLLQATAAEDAP